MTFKPTRFISSGVLVGHKNYVILQYNITLRIRESLKFCEVFKLGRLNTIPGDLGSSRNISNPCTFYHIQIRPSLSSGIERAHLSKPFMKC